jgi:hypothetical protein
MGDHQVTNWIHPYWVIFILAIGIPTLYFFGPVAIAAWQWSFG